MQDNNPEKVEKTDIEKVDPDPMVIEGIKEDQEVPETDDLVDDSGINEEDSVEKSQELSNESADDCDANDHDADNHGVHNSSPAQEEEGQLDGTP